MKRLIFTLILVLLLICKISGQQYQFGISGGLYDYYYSGIGTVGNWHLEALTPIVAGKSLSANFTLFYKYCYLKSQLNFTYDLGRIYLTNLEPEKDYGGKQIRTAIFGTSNPQIGIPLTFGLKMPLKQLNFRIFIGANPSFLINNLPVEEYCQPGDEIKVSICNSYKNLVLYGNYGIGIDYWRFTIDVIRENSITPMIETVSFEEGEYPFSLGTKRLHLVLGFNFYPWKPKKPEASPVY